MKAIFANTIIADSKNTIFPKMMCTWRGEASYDTLRVREQEAINAAWVYAKP